MQNSAEIRWFWHDATTGIESWFRSGTFPPGGGKVRVDDYLVDPRQIELGIKKRGDNVGIEVKGLVARLASRFQIGTLVANGELWTKWSSPSLRLDGLSTMSINKIRWLRKFEVTGANVREIQLGQDEEPLNPEEKIPEQGCNLELTKVSLTDNGPEWTTVGFESFGCHTVVEDILQRTIEHLKSGVLPAFGLGEKLSYPAWLASQSSSISSGQARR
jgi:hypothetical protein